MGEPVKIAIIISHPIQHFCPQYASFAGNKNVQCKVFFASALGYKKYLDPNFKKEISWGNLRLNEFDHVFLNGEEVLPSTKQLDAPLLNEELGKYRPDGVIVYGYFQKYQRRAYRWAKKNKVTIAYISDSERRQKRDIINQWIKYPFLRWYFSNISFFLTVGDANEMYYSYYGVPAGKFIRMHFPIDVEYYKSCYHNKTRLREGLRKQYNIGSDEKVLCVVGKLVSWKNQDHIIEALYMLENEGLFFYLFILGSGDMMDAWKQKASGLKKSKVYFTGFVNIEELPSYYAASDIYIHPAKIEPHSIAVSEAIYMGCPVIMSSRCGSYGANDDVQENKNGMVYRFGNIKELANKIKLLSDNKEKQTTFGNYSHQIAEVFQEKAHNAVINELLKKLGKS